MMMTSATAVLAFFDKIGLTYKVRKFFADNFVLKNFENEFEIQKEMIIKNLGEAVYLKIKNAIFGENIVKNMQEMQKYGINAISVRDNEYPNSLKNLEDYPIVLYFKGDISLCIS